jgi:hypothetical protein
MCTATALTEDNPLRDGWAIETFSSATDSLWKHFDDILANGPDAARYAEELASPSLVLDPLRPPGLKTVFDDRWLRVARQADTSGGEGAAAVSRGDAETFRGPEGLRRSAATLLAGIEEIRELRSKVKVVSVSLDEASAETEVLYQLHVRHAAGAFQVNSSWQCTWEKPAAGQGPPRLTRLARKSYEEVRNEAGGEPVFADVTSRVLAGDVLDRQLRHGVDHWLTRIEARMEIDIGGWQGLAVGDVNGDGLDDVYLSQPGGLPNRLYVQNSDGTATEMSAEAGVDWLESSHAALIVDLDNDRDQDLVVAVSSGILIHSNDGGGRFSLRAAKLLPAAHPYSLGAADYDADGDLDLYVCCYNRRQNVNYHVLFARPVPYHDANNGGPNVLLENSATPVTGEWQFQYATARTGLDHNNHRFSYAVAWEDYDNDGDQDLYVANDFGRNNLYRNDGGTFRDVAAEAGVEDIGPGMSSSWGDYDNDGWMDLYVSNMFSSAGNRITEQQQFQQQADAQTKEAFRRHARGNSLFHNQRDGSFQDVSVESAVVLGRWAWGSRFVDLNNDGWQDLLVANGFITQPDPGDL